MARQSPVRADGYTIATTDLFDAKLLDKIDPNSREFKDFMVRLQQRLNLLAIYQNNKVVGVFSLEEQINGKQYFQDPATVGTGQSSQIPRQVYHKTFDLGPLPNAGTQTYPTGLDITNTYKATDIYGSATNPGVAMIPLNFASPVLNENIKLEVIGTDIVITTAIDYSAFTSTYVTLEYVKN